MADMGAKLTVGLMLTAALILVLVL